ncbi:MAG: phosphate ABC transporter permease PstA [Bacteroidia bacterium]|nr:phosphate ABC transporter permease PstA [Bacteroidia bacterium]
MEKALINKNEGSNWRELKNKLFFGLVIVLSGITIMPILLIVYKLLSKGLRQINLDFFFKVAPDTLQAMSAVQSGEIIPGGIANGITGTLLMVAVASLIAIPVSILIGIFLYENPGKKYASLIRNLTDILQGVPSVVLGLIAYFWIVKGVTNGFSALAGSVALSIMMLPLIIRSTEETMKMIPVSIKEAGAALGVPYHRIIFKIMIPSGFSGLMTGILLSISRVLGETAPLMLTTLGNRAINFNITKPTSAVPLQIWEFYNNPNMIDLVWSSSLFLVGFVLTLNIIAKRISTKYS